jgi:hypothetical protein
MSELMRFLLAVGFGKNVELDTTRWLGENELKEELLAELS